MTDKTIYHVTIAAANPDLDVVVQPATSSEIARLKHLSGLDSVQDDVSGVHVCCACNGSCCDEAGNECMHCNGCGMCSHAPSDHDADIDLVCTQCGGTGYDHQNEEICNECYGTGMSETTDLEEMHDYGHTVEHSLARLKKYEDAASYEPLNPKQRFGHAGVDNTMMDDAEETSLLEHLTAEYAKFLLEDIDIAAGTQSPLTATDRDEFDKDPLAREEPVTDGSRSPLSRIKRQSVKR